MLGGRLAGGDDRGDEAQLAEADAGLLGGASSSATVQGLFSVWLRVVVWSCRWQQLGALCGGWDLVGDAIEEVRNAERCEREKVGSGGIFRSFSYDGNDDRVCLFKESV